MTYRDFLPGDTAGVRDLVLTTFDEFVGSGYTPRGTGNFYSYMDPDKLLERQLKGHCIILCESGKQIVGMVEVRNFDHISLFFVHKTCMGLGIGRQLFEFVRQRCRDNNPDLEAITVNSSPFAVPIYENMGFFKESEEREMNGILFTPMRFAMV